jgi:chromosome partitioning protein
MTIFCVANTKGGVGKSTTSIQITTGFALLGEDPFLVDGDKKQTSALLALSTRPAAGLKYKHTIIDVGARDSGALRAALSVADVLVVPFAPRSFDLWAYENMVELVKEAQELRDIHVVPFLNMADPSGQGSDNEATIAAIEKYGFKVASVRLGNRKAIERASALGRNVSEYKPLDTKARDEVDALVKMLLQDYGNIAST